MGLFISLGLLLPIAIGCLAGALMYWVLYTAIKAGVTDGLARSKLRIQGGNNTTTPPQAPAGFSWVLVPTSALPHFAEQQAHRMPDMRAD